MVFNNLYYLIGRDFLMEAFCQIHKNGAPGWTLRAVFELAGRQ